MTRAARLPRGLTKRKEGWRISLGPGGSGFRKSFPPSTPYEEVERALLKARQFVDAGTRTPTSGLAADVTRYLTDHFTGHPGYEERKRHLTLWVTALGAERERNGIIRDDVARTLNAWRGSGLAADTCNKRRTALLAFYHALNGRSGYNPVRDVPKFRPPDPLPRGLAYELIERTLECMTRSKTRARLAVMAYTGIRHGQLMKLTPNHWDHKTHLLTVPGTGKGRGTKPYVIPLSPAAQAALKEFDGLEAWGSFTWAPMARMWKAAATKAKLPEGTVPYDLRHSFGTEVYRQTGDLKATKELLGHASIRMTERYMLAAVPARQQAAMVTAFAGRKLPTKVASRKKRSTKRRKVPALSRPKHGFESR